MRIQHRGIGFQLEDTDQRVRLIECILFGDPLPPPLPVPPTPVPPAPEPVAPPVQVPEEVRRFWAQLTPEEQHELVLLSERPWRPEELERALGVSHQMLAGTHSRLTRLANNHGVPLSVYTTGRSRHSRRYRLTEPAVALIKLLQQAGLVRPAP